jgi:ectoine hydroxylase-related dioxygenase (phytanoyl-CoA dioxygenase family)
VILTEQQTQAYSRDGILSGLPIMPEREIQQFRQQFDALEAEEGRERAQNKLFDRHFDQPFIWEIATHPGILDCVEGLIGPDILLLSTHFFCKYGPDCRFVAWHQDLRYWGLEPPEEVSAWFAVDDSDTENGCMRVIPGSHRSGLIEHGRAETKGNLLSINQEMPVSPEDESRAMDCVLKAGEISLHHGLLVHGSLPNRSPRRRCGLTIRYIPPTVRPLAAGPIGTDWRWRPILVRGQDRQGHFQRAEPPFPRSGGKH